MNTISLVVLSISALGALLGVISLIKGKSFLERMVALDVLTTVIAGMLLVYSVVFDSPLLLDITLVYALLSFGAVLIVARYQEKGL